jgi:hypothetical protein
MVAGVKRVLIAAGCLVALAGSLRAGGSIDLADIAPVLAQRPGLWEAFTSQLEVNPHGGGLRLGAPGIPLRGWRVPPYEFRAKLKGDPGPYNLKVIVKADFDFLDERGNVTNDEMLAVSIRQKLVSLTLEVVDPAPAK